MTITSTAPDDIRTLSPDPIKHNAPPPRPCTTHNHRDARRDLLPARNRGPVTGSINRGEADHAESWRRVADHQPGLRDICASPCLR